LEKICQKTGKTKEQLQNELEVVFKELPESMVEEARKKMAVNRIVAQYRKQLSSASETFEGVVIGAPEKMDMVARFREDALRIYKENPEDAIRKGIVDPAGNPLFYEPQDRFEKLLDWQRDIRYEQKPNGTLLWKDGTKWIGKKMPESDYQRLVFGAIFKKEGTIPMVLRLRGDNCNKVIPRFVRMTFNGLKLRTTTPELYRINDAGQINFETVKEISEAELMTIFNTVFKNHLITADKFEEYYNQHTEATRFIIMKALVTEILPTQTSYGSQMVRIEDETMGFIDDNNEVIPPITCFIPESTPINFPEGSEVYVIGKPNITDRGRNIGVYGIYTPKIFRNTQVQEISGEKKW